MKLSPLFVQCQYENHGFRVQILYNEFSPLFSRDFNKMRKPHMWSDPTGNGWDDTNTARWQFDSIQRHHSLECENGSLPAVPFSFFTHLLKSHCLLKLNQNFTAAILHKPPCKNLILKTHTSLVPNGY